MGKSMRYSQSDFKTRDMSYLHECNVDKKEFFESSITLDKSIKYAKRYYGINRLDTIYDFCAGHSFSCYYALTRNYTKYAISIDIRHPNSHTKVASYYPQMIPRVQYIQNNIFLTDYKIPKNCLVLGIHPCRDLVFRIVEIAIQNKVPFVCVPCCKAKVRIKSWIDCFDDLSDYQRYSMKIVQFASSKGYDITIKKINAKYTPKNFIIIGIPNKIKS